MKRAIRIIGSVVALLVIGVLSSHHGSTTPSLSEYEAKEEQFKNHVLQNLWKDGSPKANENRAIFLAC